MNNEQVIAHYNNGVQLGLAKQHAEAERCYREALKLDPEFVPAMLNLGNQLERQGRVYEAISTWLRVISNIDTPQDAQATEFQVLAMNNVARVLEMNKRLQQAEYWLRSSLELKPAQPDVIQHYVHLRQRQCEWPVYKQVGNVSERQLENGTSALSMLGMTDDPLMQQLAAQSFVKRKVGSYCGQPYHQRLDRKKREGRIKIGYLSGNLGLHAVGLLIPELLELHDRARFEVHAFCWSYEDETSQRQRLLRAVDQFHRIHDLQDEAAARYIAAQGIDVLIDLQGLTSGARPEILTYRPAPVQVNYLGSPSTSAIPGVDWIVVDRFVVPSEAQYFYTEKLIVLNHCYQVSDRQRHVGIATTRADWLLPEDAFVFCCFNNNHKFIPEMFDVWLRILQQVPNSVLWLAAENEQARANMRAVAACSAIDLSRLIFAHPVRPSEYMTWYPLADLMLDTFPFTGGTTANDCLWMGTPLITIAGKSFSSRMAGSLLTHVWLPELVTYSIADYERLAVTLGTHPDRVKGYKRYLVEHGKKSRLFDVPGLVRELETEFEKLALPTRIAQTP